MCTLFLLGMCLCSELGWTHVKQKLEDPQSFKEPLIQPKYSSAALIAFPLPLFKCLGCGGEWKDGKTHLKFPKSRWGSLLWFEMFGLNCRNNPAPHQTTTTPTVKHGGASGFGLLFSSWRPCSRWREVSTVRTSSQSWLCTGDAPRIWPIWST